MSVEFFSQNASEVDRLTYALDMLPQLANFQNKPIYIFMDEFQDVKSLSKEYDIPELMRGSMQHHENVCYIFAGSNMTLMTEIFENKKSPFFNSTRKLKLEAFNIDELALELQKAIQTKGAVFDNDSILLGLLKKLNGHPANTMLVMGILEQKISAEEIIVIKKEHLDAAYEDALEEMNDLISEYLKEIKSKEHLHDVLYRIAKNENQILESSLLLQKKKALVDMGYLNHKGRGDYEIIDGFLEESLRRI